MISDIDEHMEHSTLSSFADDTRLKKAIQNLLDTFKLQADLNRIYKWAMDNNMMLNGKKFEHIHYGKHTTSTGYFTEHSKIIEEKSTVKDLGVLLTDDAKFKKHINSMIKKATELVGWVLRTFKSRSKEVMTTLWKSLISHHLDYCSQLWNPQEKGLIQGIEAVQRSFTQQKQCQINELLGMTEEAWHVFCSKEERKIHYHLNLEHPRRLKSKYSN